MEKGETQAEGTAVARMTPLQSHLARIKHLIESGQLKTDSDVSVCRFCYGSGFEPTASGARRCRCRLPAIVAERLSKIPPRYRDANIAAMSARDDLHPKQRVILDYIKLRPEESYVLCGRPDTGKTHFLWAIYRMVSHNTERRVVACSMLQLINDYREAFKPQREDGVPYQIKTVKPNDLMQAHTPYSLFLDDLDKPKITEYVAEQVHALMDAAYINNHQIVVTTNLSPDRLVELFERADDRYGRAIVRRIIHSENNLIELF